MTFFVKDCAGGKIKNALNAEADEMIQMKEIMV